MDYSVHAPRPPLTARWTDPAWAERPALEIASFRPESGDHRPPTRARLAYDENGLAGVFHVRDRYVRSVHTRFGEPVYQDSCVEIFLQPKPGKGYLNFEMNAGGTLLASHITDHRRTPDGFAAFTRLTDEDGGLVAVRSSLPRVVEPEVRDPLEWELAFFIPILLLEKYVGPIGPLGGQNWRANLYKCADGTSHPHWASWSPVDALNFHLPGCFGRLAFEP
jgi:cellulose/xylan binding protein with CBM9 domain